MVDMVSIDALITNPQEVFIAVLRSSHVALGVEVTTASCPLDALERIGGACCLRRAAGSVYIWCLRESTAAV
jgi:hypothetical protein